MTTSPPDVPPLPPADPQAVPPAPPPGPARRCGLAIASLICGIIGPLTLGLASIVAVILGIVGLVKISKSQGALGGKGMAIAGIVLGGLFFLALPFIALMAAIIAPAFISARGTTHAVMSRNNLKQLGRAAQTYAVMRDGALPSPDRWPQELEEFYGSDRVLKDPANPDGGRAYAMNAALGGMRLDSIPERSRTVLFFECVPGAPPSGGPGLLPTPPRHRRHHNIAFCDGHIEAIPLEELDTLIWDPKAGPAGETREAAPPTSP